MSSLVSALESFMDRGIEIGGTDTFTQVNERTNLARLKKALCVAKELGLDIKDERTMSSVVILACNFDHITNDEKQVLMRLMDSTCNYTTRAIKQTPQYTDLMSLLQAVV
ncbi:hypothetical protein VIBNISFn27_p10036 [Vibrio nigripulchritudo SFn27]|uniref:Uncharacterized protein n=2 Tax=Vibrio nigripulchritudo TaxID=28173 RepID=A0A9P1JLX4_9VIBR|nr:hypothetical protein [Vibrio nigripulchritudo]CBJ93082.1 Protein of unknown function [Vibrio nigripulchritudo]CCN85895.1 hypothetical protein VIBNIBLFn1_p0032 [Vibrio nigripulchritudo BLFn1]CCN91886.1 hypothetical protein VIBNISFn27_p10036 [Vibrio nigripulchritudo SFn27]CCN97692.1 hypothetical protein VIBNIENn2_p0032 [Vibrio nigripulchritudo ENn2]CCO43923.1 hypothetical protein VIBNISFn135_p10036 [Vibrio nigripulchritudo SFn135]